MIDSKGNKWGSISGFRSIESISAGIGYCWVADHFEGKVYRFDHAITEDRNITDLFPSEFAVTFNDPRAVSVILQKESASWVADRGTGSLVKLNHTGKETARFTGVVDPKTIRINQRY